MNDTTTPAAVIRPTEYTVSLLPEDDVNHRAFAITVQYRGGGRWAITLGEHACLGRDGTWAPGVKPYGRGDAWLGAHRFDRDAAIELAREAAAKVTVNGITAMQAWARTQAATEDGAR